MEHVLNDLFVTYICIWLAFKGAVVFFILMIQNKILEFASQNKTVSDVMTEFYFERTGIELKRDK